MPAYDSINNLLASLQIPHTATQVHDIDTRLLGKYEMICQESISTVDGANDRYTGTVDRFLTKESSLLQNARWVGTDLIVDLFANSLNGGKGCPPGSPPEVRSSLRHDFSSLGLVMEFQSRMGAARHSDVALAQYYHISSVQAHSVAKKLDDGFFVSRNEIEALKIIRDLTYDTHRTSVGSRLMNMITWGDLGQPLYPAGFGELVVGVREHIGDIGDWRYFLKFILGKLSRGTEIEAVDWQWETAVIVKVNETVTGTKDEKTIQKTPLIRSLVALLDAGLHKLTAEFLRMIDAWEWDADPTINVLLHIAASQPLDAVRKELVGTAIGMIDGDSFFEGGEFRLPSRIAAFLVYPQVSEEIEVGLSRFLTKVLEDSKKGDFLGEDQGIDLALAFVESLRKLYASLAVHNVPHEWKNLVSESIAFRLLENALGRELNRASIGLFRMALEKASGLYWDEMGDAEQYIAPLIDPLEREFLDATTLEWEDYLDDYNRRHRKGGGGTGGLGGTVSGMVDPEDTGEISGGLFSAHYSAQLYYQNPRVNSRQRTQTLRQRSRSPSIVNSMRIFYGVPANARNVLFH